MHDEHDGSLLASLLQKRALEKPLRDALDALVARSQRREDRLDALAEELLALSRHTRESSLQQQEQLQQHARALDDLQQALAVELEPLSVRLDELEAAILDLTVSFTPDGYVYVPPGEAYVGMGQADDQELRRFVLTRGFWMKETPVTNEEWWMVMDVPEAQRSGGPLHPVVQVSWYDALLFCNRLSEREGLSPCYQLESGEVRFLDAEVQGYRLPSEVEWEYAARANTHTPRYSNRSLSELAWFSQNSRNGLKPVRLKTPNAWGLYDMLGNVYEWCWRESYEPGHLVEMDIPLERIWGDGAYRVARGGSWSSFERQCHTAFRYFALAAKGGDHIGFRPVITAL